MKKTFNRGFTLIELLVVIAIIGILSSVVLASLNTARAKGADAAIKSNLNNIRAQAELRYDTDGQTYLNVCTDANVVKGVQAAAAAAGITWTAVASNLAGSAVCNSAAGGWAAQVALKSSATTKWCVDYTGVASSSTVNLASGAANITCP
jgi:prepilin-type N-terminal cleavage/methylation domain-containing protein